MADKEIAVIDGNTFMLSDNLGEVVGGTPHGLYYADTRFLSGYTMRLNGQRLLLLSAGNLTPTSASFYLTNPASQELPQGSISILRDRSVVGAIHDDFTVINHGNTTLDLVLAFTFAADFADIFEVRNGNIAKAGRITIEGCGDHDLAGGSGQTLTFSYHRAEFVRSTCISFSSWSNEGQEQENEGPEIKDNQATFRFRLPARGEWRTSISVAPRFDNGVLVQTYPPAAADADGGTIIPLALREGPRNASFDIERDPAPVLLTDDARLRFAFDQALKDLAGLRLQLEGGYQLPVAGLPWYMAVFGRDSIITALQTMLLGPDLAIGTLRALAGYQSRRFDSFRDEEPGKIPHEIRFGELASLEEVPHSRYYGTADATPLFVVLISETYRWTGDLELVKSLRRNLDAALQWIDRYGDADGDGFVEYARKSLHGLINQGWKDSPDSVCFRDGTIATPPIATAEIQGYVYDAKVRAAELFELLGEPERAAELRSQAGELKRRFNDDFWMPEEGYFAIALDAEKRKVDSITSNPGHSLWSGIVDGDKARAIAERLMAEDMFSGWGVRTMSSRMGAYNPLSYHNGSIWPHDNSLVAAGLWRYGFQAEALAVINAMLDASAHFSHHCLPELFSGFPRRPSGFPVEYLGANSPQAWASGAVVFMLQTLLGAAPERSSNGEDNRIGNSPLANAPRIHLCGVPFRGRQVELMSPRPQLA